MEYLGTRSWKSLSKAFEVNVMVYVKVFHLTDPKMNKN